jgi:hypothetical protein
MKTPLGDNERRRVLFMARVPDGQEARFLRKLHPLVTERQWNPEWTITKVFLADLKESHRTLGRHGPCRGGRNGHNLFILVNATDQDTLATQAIPQIHQALGLGGKTAASKGTTLMGHVLLGAMDVNGTG